MCSRVFLTTRLTTSGDNESVATNGAGIFECGNGGIGSIDESVGESVGIECGNGDNGVGVQSIGESVVSDTGDRQN